MKEGKDIKKNMEKNDEDSSENDYEEKESDWDNNTVYDKPEKYEKHDIIFLLMNYFLI